MAGPYPAGSSLLPMVDLLRIWKKPRAPDITPAMAISKPEAVN